MENYLLGWYFIIHIDQQILRFIMQQREVGAEYHKQVKWVNELGSISKFSTRGDQGEPDPKMGGFWAQLFGLRSGPTRFFWGKFQAMGNLDLEK